MHGKKVLVTGATGMLGSNILKVFENSIPLDSTIDISNLSLVTQALQLHQPDIIIHTAAYTNVEECEEQHDKAYCINTLGTQNLVNYCIDKEVLFIYISSTGIYGTQKDREAYTEFDSVTPLTIHHKSKYEGEKVIINHLNQYLIIRTGWLYGGDKTHAKNFVYKRFLEAQNKELIYSDNSQIGNPTFVEDLIRQIEVLIEHNQYGLFNCVNRASGVSRYDYVKKTIELFNVDCEVKVAPSGMFERIAPISANESAINYKLELLNLNVMSDWELSLETYINQLKKEF